MNMYGVDPEKDVAHARSLKIFPVNDVQEGYTASHYQKELDDTYTAVPNCASIHEMEMIDVVRSAAVNLSQLKAALGINE